MNIEALLKTMTISELERLDAAIKDNSFAAMVKKEYDNKKEKEIPFPYKEGDYLKVVDKYGCLFFMRLDVVTDDTCFVTRFTANPNTRVVVKSEDIAIAKKMFCNYNITDYHYKEIEYTNEETFNKIDHLWHETEILLEQLTSNLYNEVKRLS